MTTDPETAYTGRMLFRHGYQPADVRRCPAVVAGRPCQASAGLDGPPCLCERYARLLDHARVWRDHARRLVLTAEPYHADAHALAALAADCAPLGLDVRLDGRACAR